MFITTLLAVGGAVYAGVQVYRKSQESDFIDDLQDRFDDLQEQMDYLQKRVGTSLQLLTTLPELKDDDDEAIALNTVGIETEIKHMNRNLVIATASLGLSLVHLTPLAIAGMAYLTIPIWKETYRRLVKQRRVSIIIIDALILPTLMFVGYIKTAALSYWLLFAALKLMGDVKNRSEAKLVNVFGDQPQSVWIQGDGCEIQIPFQSLQVGDVVVVQAGEMIPIDGVIVDGVASIEQGMLTGETQPVEKGVGDTVFGATIVLAGKVWIKTEKTGGDTVAAQIGKTLQKTTQFIDTFLLRADQLQDRLTLPVLTASALAVPVSGVVGAVTILTSALPDTLRLASPISVLNYLHIASNIGILIKDGRALELLKQVDTFVFDKTGTLTQEQPHIGKIYPCGVYTEEEILIYAAAAEAKQTHPIGRAIRQAAQERLLEVPAIDEAHYELGYGIKVRFKKSLIRVGSFRFMTQENISIPPQIEAVQAYCYEQEFSLVYVAVDDALAGAIELHPTIRPEAKEIVSHLKEKGYSLIIISGDHQTPTRRLAEDLGIDRYFAETLPQNKAALIDSLKAEGRSICFVGDGINDAIALKKAHVSISLRGASTVATDTAQVILMDGNLEKLKHLLELAQGLDTSLQRSLFATLAPTVICVGGVFFLHLGIFGGIGLYYASLATGIGSAMLPYLNHQVTGLKKETNKKIIEGQAKEEEISE